MGHPLALAFQPLIKYNSSKFYLIIIMFMEVSNSIMAKRFDPDPTADNSA